ncbi:MAG: hypothetical protein LBU45_03935 [Azoarcus sp.]|nr:hypothetical protein [Azoarcus sp.]
MDKEKAGKRPGASPDNKSGRIVLSAAMLGLALLALRYGVIENELLPRDCGAGSSPATLSCGLTWLLIQSYQMQRLGWCALAFGALGFFLGSRRCAWIGWLAGVAGMALYSVDYAAPGALLGLFTLLRTPRSKRGAAPSCENG